MRAWNLIYPVGIYFVVTAVLLFLLDFVLPDTKGSHLSGFFLAGRTLGKKGVSFNKKGGGDGIFTVSGRGMLCPCLEQCAFHGTYFGLLRQL